MYIRSIPPRGSIPGPNRNGVLRPTSVSRFSVPFSVQDERVLQARRVCRRSLAATKDYWREQAEELLAEFGMVPDWLERLLKD